MDKHVSLFVQSNSDKGKMSEDTDCLGKCQITLFLLPLCSGQTGWYVCLMRDFKLSLIFVITEIITGKCYTMVINFAMDKHVSLFVQSKSDKGKMSEDNVVWTYSESRADGLGKCQITLFLLPLCSGQTGWFVCLMRDFKLSLIFVSKDIITGRSDNRKCLKIVIGWVIVPKHFFFYPHVTDKQARISV